MIAFGEGHLTVKFVVRVGHLNSVLAPHGGNLNKPIFKSIKAWGGGGGGGIADVLN